MYLLHSSNNSCIITVLAITNLILVQHYCLNTTYQQQLNDEVVTKNATLPLLFILWKTLCRHQSSSLSHLKTWHADRQNQVSSHDTSSVWKSTAGYASRRMKILLIKCIICYAVWIHTELLVLKLMTKNPTNP